MLEHGRHQEVTGFVRSSGFEDPERTQQGDVECNTELLGELAYGRVAGIFAGFVFATGQHQ